MSTDGSWVFVGTVPDGQSFTIEGVNVWKHKWTDTGERVLVQDPQCHQNFTFHVYSIQHGGKLVFFAAGEFSNCMWGFYAKR